MSDSKRITTVVATPSICSYPQLSSGTDSSFESPTVNISHRGPVGTGPQVDQHVRERTPPGHRRPLRRVKPGDGSASSSRSASRGSRHAMRDSQSAEGSVERSRAPRRSPGDASSTQVVARPAPGLEVPTAAERLAPNRGAQAPVVELSAPLLDFLYAQAPNHGADMAIDHVGQPALGDASSSAMPMASTALAMQSPSHPSLS